MSITFSDKSYQHIMDRVGHSRQMVQSAWHNGNAHMKMYYISHAMKALTDLAEALKNGTIEAEV